MSCFAELSAPGSRLLAMLLKDKHKDAFVDHPAKSDCLSVLRSEFKSWVPEDVSQVMSFMQCVSGRL